MNITEFCIKNPTISALDRVTMERMYANSEPKTEKQWFELLKNDFSSVGEAYNQSKQKETKKQ